MYCADCGKEVPADARFCPVCATGRREPAPALDGTRRKGLIPGLAVAAIILLAGLGAGLFFGLNGGSTTEAASAPISTRAVAPSTTVAPSTQSLPTTGASSVITGSRGSGQPTATGEGVKAGLRTRTGKWIDLLESIPTAGRDLTAEIATFLTPKESARQRAAEYQEAWSIPADPDAIVETDFWEDIPEVLIDPDGIRAVAVAGLKLVCRDGVTTRGLEALSWKRVDGEWLRTIEYDPLSPEAGPLVPFGASTLAGQVLWSPVTLHELKHLAAVGGPAASGMFLAVEFFVRNDSDHDVIPRDWQLSVVGANGKAYDRSPEAEGWWREDVEARTVPVAPHGATYLWYTFAVPENLDLPGLRFRVAPSGA